MAPVQPLSMCIADELSLSVRNSVESLFCFCNKKELGSKEDREFKIKPEAWREWAESARTTALSIYQPSKKKKKEK